MTERRLTTLSHRIGFWETLLVTLFWMAFSLLSGAEERGGGLIGTWRNGPNALPWLLPLGLAVPGRRWPGAAGLGILILPGLAAVYFVTWCNAVTFTGVTLTYVVFGAAYLKAAFSR